MDDGIISVEKVYESKFYYADRWLRQWQRPMPVAKRKVGEEGFCRVRVTEHKSDECYTLIAVEEHDIWHDWTRVGKGQAYFIVYNFLSPFTSKSN